MFYKFRLQRKERIAIPNVLGNHSMPVHSYRWKDIAISNNKAELEKYLPNSEDYRIEEAESVIPAARNK